MFEQVSTLIISGLVAGVLPALKAIWDTFRENRDLRKQKEVVRRLEIGANQGKHESFIDFFARELRATVERERLAMIRAESSSRVLAALGTWLMVLSVFAPLASAALYASLPPISPETVQTLIQLKTQLGFTPGAEAISTARDWHILLAGLSLGFLFVAAARGVLRQEAQQRAVFFRVVRRVSYFENLVTALRVRQRLHEEPSLEVRTACIDILSELTKPTPAEAPDSTEPSQEAEASLPFKEQIEAFTAALKTK